MTVQRDPLKWVHDIAETVLLVGALVALSVYVIRDRRDPIDLFGQHAGMETSWQR
jgi:hypothetical protein